MYQKLSPQLARFRANNPGPMTASGTNAYILGDQQQLIIDPGPLDDEHIEQLLSCCGQQLRWILVTHTHHDHSPAATRLAAKTGAQLIGPKPADDNFQDNSFCPDVLVADNQRLLLGEIELQAIHTPGHVSNHFCYYWPAQQMLFSGDHIMQGSTVVIIPPAGDMFDYMASLQRVLDLPLAAIAPGHGELINEPTAEIKALIQHRKQRESKVITVLSALQQGSLEQLLEQVYDDVNHALHGVAKLSLWAHLLKLEREKRVRQKADNWYWLGDD